MHGRCTAYITGGSVFSVCASIQTRLGTFNQDALRQFNEKTEGRYEAVEILSNRASFGQLYRIEYNQMVDMPCI